MESGVQGPVAVVPVGAVSSTSLLWRTKGRLHVSVVVKACFSLVDGQSMVVAPPEPLRPERGELAPYLGQTDVVLEGGHAYAVPARPVSALSVKLALVRDWPVIDKSLLVYPRERRADGGHVVVSQLALGAGAGPLGLVVDPTNPAREGQLAALGAGSAARLAILGDAGVPRVDGATVVIDERFPWSYYQVAPPDQRCDHLRGDEWVVLEGMHPAVARWSSRLPRPKAQAAVYPPGLKRGVTYPIAMIADQLFVEPDRGICSVVWRGSFPVVDEAAARSMTIVSGLALPGQPVPWPSFEALAQDPRLAQYGVTPVPEDEDPEAFVETQVVERSFDPAMLEVLALARSGDVLELSLDDEGVLGLCRASEAEEDEDPETIAVAPREAAALRSALGLPVPRRQLLRPAQIVGLPWVDAEPAATESEASAVGPAPSGPGEAPVLEVHSIDELELTLSDSMVAEGIASLAELEAWVDAQREAQKPTK
ncbi:MAG: DUF2169 domain-containing protein [Polyangiaceae bacterium]